MLRLMVLLVLLLVLTWPLVAGAEPSDGVGCIVVRGGDGPRRLVVVLHGDEGSPIKVAGAWREAAKKHGLVVFLPRCPRSEGCQGSWWRWRGDPAWLLGQVEKIAAIDPERRYLAGWSG